MVIIIHQQLLQTFLEEGDGTKMKVLFYLLLFVALSKSDASSKLAVLKLNSYFHNMYFSHSTSRKTVTIPASVG